MYFAFHLVNLILQLNDALSAVFVVLVQLVNGDEVETSLEDLNYASDDAYFLASGLATLTADVDHLGLLVEHGVPKEKAKEKERDGSHGSPEAADLAEESERVHRGQLDRLHWHQVSSTGRSVRL